MGTQYALQDMLRIRRRREERAGKELVAARRAQDEAQAALRRSQQELETFRGQKADRANRLFAAVIGQVVRREVLDRLKEELARLDEQELLLAAQVSQAQQTLEERGRAAEQAHRRYVEENRNVTKIQTHKAAWEEEEAREQERRQDAEMEEFSGRRLTNDDFDDFD